MFRHSQSTKNNKSGWLDNLNGISNLIPRGTLVFCSIHIAQLITHAALYFFFFSVWVFFHDHSLITGLQGKGEGISLTPHYHFHLLHRHLDISRAITAESSPLHIASSRTRTGNLWFPSASREQLSYAPNFSGLIQRLIMQLCY